MILKNSGMAVLLISKHPHRERGCCVPESITHSVPTNRVALRQHRALCVRAVQRVRGVHSSPGQSGSNGPFTTTRFFTAVCRRVQHWFQSAGFQLGRVLYAHGAGVIWTAPRFSVLGIPYEMPIPYERVGKGENAPDWSRAHKDELTGKSLENCGTSYVQCSEWSVPNSVIMIIIRCHDIVVVVCTHSPLI